MLDAEDDYDLQTIFAIDEVQTLIYETGFRKPLSEIKLKDKREVISILIDYNCMVKVKAAIDQYCAWVAVPDCSPKNPGKSFKMEGVLCCFYNCS